MTYAVNVNHSNCLCDFFLIFPKIDFCLGVLLLKMYASSDVNIVIMMKFFELFLLRKISEFPSVWEHHKLHHIFLSKNVKNNIYVILTICTSELAYIF